MLGKAFRRGAFGVPLAFSRHGRSRSGPVGAGARPVQVTLIGALLDPLVNLMLEPADRAGTAKLDAPGEPAFALEAVNVGIA
jgi:hypothetical protein